MKELSNNTLVLIAVISIAIALFNILLSLGGGITGLVATTDVGYVNVTVISAAYITVHTKSVNFTGAIGGEARNSYNSTEVDTICDATLGGCVPCGTDNHCGMNISNDGSVFINITIQELSTDTLFDSGSYSANTHFLYNVTMQDPGYTIDYGANGNCSVGYDRGFLGIDGATWGQWRAMPRTAAEVAVCYLNNTDDLGACTTGHNGDTDICPDVARIEFNITVPGDEGAGDKAGTIQFVASASV